MPSRRGRAAPNTWGSPSRASPVPVPLSALPPFPFLVPVHCSFPGRKAVPPGRAWHAASNRRRCLLSGDQHELNTNLAAIDLASIHVIQGFLSILPAFIFHISKPTWEVHSLVDCDLHMLDVSKVRKDLLHVISHHIPCQLSNIQPCGLWRACVPLLGHFSSCFILSVPGFRTWRCALRRLILPSRHRVARRVLPRHL